MTLITFYINFLFCNNQYSGKSINALPPPASVNTHAIKEDLTIISANKEFKTYRVQVTR